MGISSTYPYLPVWLIGLVFLLGLVLVREAVAALRHRYGDLTKDSDDGVTLTASLGLLAFLIGFTFSMTLQRYDTKRQLVVKEANALGTTWLRTDLLAADDRQRVQAILREYVDQRIVYGESHNETDEDAAYAQTLRQQDALWKAVIQAVAPDQDSEFGSLMISTTNESIDLAAERKAARKAHTPPRILRILAIYALVAAGIVGFQKSRHRISTTLFFALLSLAVVLIYDMDRPTTGMINISQQPMLDLKESIQ